MAHIKSDSFVDSASSSINKLLFDSSKVSGEDNYEEDFAESTTSFVPTKGVAISATKDSYDDDFENSVSPAKPAIRGSIQETVNDESIYEVDFEEPAQQTASKIEGSVDYGEDFEKSKIEGSVDYGEDFEKSTTLLPPSSDVEPRSFELKERRVDRDEDFERSLPAQPENKGNKAVEASTNASLEKEAVNTTRRIYDEAISNVGLTLSINKQGLQNNNVTTTKENEIVANNNTNIESFDNVDCKHNANNATDEDTTTIQAHVRRISSEFVASKILSASRSFIVSNSGNNNSSSSSAIDNNAIINNNKDTTKQLQENNDSSNNENNVVEYAEEIETEQHQQKNQIRHEQHPNDVSNNNNSDDNNKPPMKKVVSIVAMQVYEPSMSLKNQQQGNNSGNVNSSDKVTGIVRNIKSANNAVSKLRSAVNNNKNNNKLEEPLSLPKKKEGVPRLSASAKANQQQQQQQQQRPHSSYHTSNNNNNDQTFLTSVPNNNNDTANTDATITKKDLLKRSLSHHIQTQDILYSKQLPKNVAARLFQSHMETDIKLSKFCAHRKLFAQCGEFLCQDAHEKSKWLNMIRYKAKIAYDLIIDADILWREKLKKSLDVAVEDMKTTHEQELNDLKKSLYKRSKNSIIFENTYKYIHEQQEQLTKQQQEYIKKRIEETAILQHHDDNLYHPPPVINTAEIPDFNYELYHRTGGLTDAHMEYVRKHIEADHELQNTRRKKRLDMKKYEQMQEMDELKKSIEGPMRYLDRLMEDQITVLNQAIHKVDSAFQHSIKQAATAGSKLSNMREVYLEHIKRNSQLGYQILRISLQSIAQVCSDIRHIYGSASGFINEKLSKNKTTIGGDNNNNNTNQPRSVSPLITKQMRQRAKSSHGKLKNSQSNIIFISNDANNRYNLTHNQSPTPQQQQQAQKVNKKRPETAPIRTKSRNRSKSPTNNNKQEPQSPLNQSSFNESNYLTDDFERISTSIVDNNNMFPPKPRNNNSNNNNNGSDVIYDEDDDDDAGIYEDIPEMDDVADNFTEEMIENLSYGTDLKKQKQGYRNNNNNHNNSNGNNNNRNHDNDDDGIVEDNNVIDNNTIPSSIHSSLQPSMEEEITSEHGISLHDRKSSIIEENMDTETEELGKKYRRDSSNNNNNNELGEGEYSLHYEDSIHDVSIKFKEYTKKTNNIKRSKSANNKKKKQKLHEQNEDYYGPNISKMKESKLNMKLVLEELLDRAGIRRRLKRKTKTILNNNNNNNNTNNNNSSTNITFQDDNNIHYFYDNGDNDDEEHDHLINRRQSKFIKQPTTASFDKEVKRFTHTFKKNQNQRCFQCNKKFEGDGKFLPNTALKDGIIRERVKNRLDDLPLLPDFNKKTRIQSSKRNDFFIDILHNTSDNFVNGKIYCSWECAKEWIATTCPMQLRYEYNMLIDLTAGYIV